MMSNEQVAPETKGTWPPENMMLVRAQYEWGFLRNDPIEVAGIKAGILDAVGQYLRNSEEGDTTDLYGDALHVQVIGTRLAKQRNLL